MEEQMECNDIPEDVKKFYSGLFTAQKCSYPVSPSNLKTLIEYAQKKIEKTKKESLCQKVM